MSATECNGFPGHADQEIASVRHLNCEYRATHIDNVGKRAPRQVPDPDLAVLAAGEGERAVAEILAGDRGDRAIMLGRELA
jgi:hypothetical protein